MGLLKLLDRLFHGPAWLTFSLWESPRANSRSFNLLYLFQANFALIATYGAIAAF